MTRVVRVVAAIASLIVLNGGETPVAANRRRLVDMERVRGRRGVEPELERPAGPAIAVAVDRGSGCVDDRRRGRTLWLEAQPNLVVAIAAAAVARVGHGWVEGRVAGTRHGEEVGALIEVESDEGINAVEVVIAGDQFPLPGGRVQTIKRQDAVEQADNRLARTADDRFGREPAGGRQRKLIDVDIGAVGRIELGEMNRVVITGKHGLARELAHDRGEIVGVIEPERMSDLVHRNLEPRPAVLTGTPVFCRIHDRPAAPGKAARRLY